MKIWQLEGDHYPLQGGRGYSRDAYNQHDSEYSKGYEDGYCDAMSKVYGERSIRRSGQGLSREVYMRDPYMEDDEEYMERRRRDRMGRYM